MKARPILQGAGLSTLYMAPFAADFLTQGLGYSYHRLHPLTPIFRAILVLTFLLWIGGGLAFLALERLPPRWKRVFWFLPIALLPWFFFHDVSAAFNSNPVMAITILEVGRLFSLAVAVVALLLLLAASKMTAASKIYDACISGIRVCYMVAGFGLFVIIPRIGLHALQSGPREQSSFVRDPLPAVPPSAPRIVWVLMDELSYDQVFASRQPDVLLPNFDRLAKTSVVFSSLKPVGAATEVVLPALLLGKSLVRLREPYSELPSYRSTKGGVWHRFNEYDTIFADAHSLAWTTGLAGWYNPYCRLLPDVLDRCVWVYTEPVASTDFSADLSTTKSISGNLWAMAPAKLSFIMQGPANKLVRTHTNDYLTIMAQAKAVIEDSRIRFAFVHLPIPHPPGIYDRVHHRISDHGTYLDNLVLADQSLGALQAVIQDTPAAANTTLIVSSDHSWRTRTWKTLPDWSEQETRATHGGKFDDRPVLMVSLPGAVTGQVIAKPVSAMAVHPILQALLRGQIHTPADLSNLVAQEPQE